jgi:hypothetical protein
MIDHYNRYDLRAMLESLNEAIVTNHPDIIEKYTKDVSEILDNVWNDPQIPRLIKGLAFGIPISMAAIGNVATGPIGAASGFLAGLGFEVLRKAVDVGAEALSEKAAKLFAKSYQINVYNFKKKYKDRLAKHTS